MSKTLLTKLRQDLGDTWEEAKRLNDKTKDGDEFTSEEQRIWDMLNDRMNETRDRINQLEESEKRDKELDEQRAEYEAIVRPTDPRAQRGQERGLEDRLLEFVRGCLPDAEWAPRAIQFKLTSQDKRPFEVNDRTGIQRGLEARDLTKLSAGAGGNLVPTSFLPRLYEHLVERAAVRQTNAIVYTTDSGEALQVPKTSSYGTAVLTAEAGAIAESDPAFGQVTLNSFKYPIMIQVSTELLQDSGIDVISFLAREAGLIIGQASGVHFVTGTGTGQPEGVQTNVTVGKTGTTGQTTTVIGDDLFDLYHSIVSGYRSRGFWFTLDASLAKIRKIKDTTNQYLWQPGLQDGIPDRLLGRPVVTDPNMPVMAANAKSILFGDFSAYYAIRDVSTVRFERSDDFAFGNDLVSFRAVLRTDGRPIDLTAVKAYQNSAT